MKLNTIGIDLGKTVFHLVGLNERGEVVVRRKLSRTHLLRFTNNRHVHLIGMEACSGAHFLGRALREQGHEVRLIPAQYVKPYVKTNKNDFIDAEAIAEAVTRPNMRFVPIKSDDQLDLQSLHRVRERWVMRRTAVVNQMRSLLLERGITLRNGRCHLEAALPGILEERGAFHRGSERYAPTKAVYICADQPSHSQFSLATRRRTIHSHIQTAWEFGRLDAIPGIGPITATAVIAAIGNGAGFDKGRDFAAWVGLGEVAFLIRAGAWRIARNELAMRPLLQPQLSISSKLIARDNDSSRVVSEFVRTLSGSWIHLVASNSTCAFRWKLHDRLSPTERGTTCTFRASDEWRAGPSLGLRDVPGKSKTGRRACSSYRPPVCAHAASQYIRSKDERHDENRIKFIPSTATAIQL